MAIALFGAKIPQLTEYESFSHFDSNKYTTQYSRAFDKDGIITQNNQYHPLTIAIYGIMSYDAFMRTHDSLYYYRVLHQYKYFSDTSRIVFSDNGLSVGLPYKFDFKGMKAPWYSGMTQGTAVSYLLRYHALTNDKSALDLSQKLIHLMLKPEKEGGTLGRTAEGGLWIEEYPGAHGSKSVLNGFINGFIGLHEYCAFFPEDKRAAMVRDSCYIELIKTVGKYDQANWTCYSRNSGAITNSYLRYELEEFDHLYTMFGDERLRTQMRIWSKFGFNKPDNELKFLILPNYQFAIPLQGNPANEKCSIDHSEAFAKGFTVQAPVKAKKGSTTYSFAGDRYHGEIKVLAQEMKASAVTVTATYRGKKVQLTCSYSDKRVTFESQVPFDALEVKYPKQRSRKSYPVSVSTYDYKTCALPLFMFCEVSKQETLMKGKSYHFDFEGTNLTNAKVLYRHAPAGKNTNDYKYSVEQSFNLAGGCFEAPADGTYQFFISYDLMHPASSLGQLKLVAE